MDFFVQLARLFVEEPGLCEVQFYLDEIVAMRVLRRWWRLVRRRREEVRNNLILLWSRRQDLRMPMEILDCVLSFVAGDGGNSLPQASNNLSE